MKRSGSNGIRVAMLLLLILISLTCNAFAEESIEVSIPYTHDFKTEIRTADSRFCYVMTPLDGAPQQIEKNEYWIEGHGERNGTFPLRFTHAGEYSYILSASPNYRNSGYVYEDMTYTITVDVKESGNKLELGYFIIQGSDNKKYDALYLDPTYTESVPSPTVSPTPRTTASPIPTNNGKGQYTPKTGDDFQMMLWVSIAGISAIAIFFLLLFGRKKKKEENET